MAPNISTCLSFTYTTLQFVILFGLILNGQLLAAGARTMTSLPISSQAVSSSQQVKSNQKVALALRGEHFLPTYSDYGTHSGKYSRSFLELVISSLLCFPVDKLFATIFALFLVAAVVAVILASTAA